MKRWLIDDEGWILVAMFFGFAAMTWLIIGGF